MEKLFDVFYKNAKGEKCSVRYCCIDKSQTRRLFYSEALKGEEIIEIKEV